MGTKVRRSNVSVLKKTISELGKFGGRTVYYHMRQRIKFGDSERYNTLYLCERDRFYRRMDQGQLAEELRKNYLMVQGVDLDYRSPSHFTEKIQWLKIFDSTDKKMRLADKYAVRDWVSGKIDSGYLIPLLGVWNRFEDIDFDSLPASFCLKTNHGSGMNLPVKDKQMFDLPKACKLFGFWMERPFWAASIEPHYRDMPRKIIAEEYIGGMDGGLYDYKFHCFNGTPVFVQCIGDRDLVTHTGYQKHYDMEWNGLDWTFGDYPDFPYDVKKPECLDEMKYIAEILSAGFAYVRIDLYEIGGKVYFGEMTFTPSSGFYPYKDRWTEEKDLELGKWIVLPKKKSLIL